MIDGARIRIVMVVACYYALTVLAVLVGVRTRMAGLHALHCTASPPTALRTGDMTVRGRAYLIVEAELWRLVVQYWCLRVILFKVSHHFIFCSFWKE